MAQTERNAKALNWTNSGSQAAEIASLRAAVAAGNTIFANDLNRIATLINNMNGHVHTYDDAYQLVILVIEIIIMKIKIQIVLIKLLVHQQILQVIQL